MARVTSKERVADSNAAKHYKFIPTRADVMHMSCLHFGFPRHAADTADIAVAASQVELWENESVSLASQMPDGVPYAAKLIAVITELGLTQSKTAF